MRAEGGASALFLANDDSWKIYLLPTQKSPHTVLDAVILEPLLKGRWENVKFWKENDDVVSKGV